MSDDRTPQSWKQSIANQLWERNQPPAKPANPEPPAAMTERERGKMEETMLDGMNWPMGCDESFKTWWGKLVTGQFGYRYDSLSVLEVARKAFQAGRTVEAGERAALAREPQPSGAGEELEARPMPLTVHCNCGAGDGAKQHGDSCNISKWARFAGEGLEGLVQALLDEMKDCCAGMHQEKVDAVRAALRHSTPSAPTPLPHVCGYDCGCGTPSAGEVPPPLPHVRKALHDGLDWVRQTEHEDFIWKKLSEALEGQAAELRRQVLKEAALVAQYDEDPGPVRIRIRDKIRALASSSPTAPAEKGDNNVQR